MGLMDIRRRILADAPQLATASGAVASFSTDMAAKLKKCEFSIVPVQSGSGDPSPSNVRPISGWTGVAGQRTGVNVWDEQVENGYWNVTNGAWLANDDNIAAKNKFPIKGGETYYFGCTTGGINTNNFGYVFYDADGEYISGNVTRINSAITAPSNACYCAFFVPKSWYGQTYANNISINYPATDTAYHPYTAEQIAVTFPAQGKNLLASIEDKTQALAGGSVTLTKGQSTISIVSPFTQAVGFRFGQQTSVVLPAGTYTFSCSIPQPSDTAGLFLFDTTTTSIIVRANSTHSRSFTLSAEATVALGVNLDSDTTSGDYVFQLEAGSTATSYEPYTNTVYGGTVDVVSGVLTVDRASVLLRAFDFTTLSTPDQHVFRAPFVNVLPNIVDHANGGLTYGDICDSFTYKEWSPFSASDNGMFSFSPKPNNKFVVVDHRYSTISDFQAAVKDVRLVYFLATPITYQLTSQQINALKGQNNVWCDTGDTTVTYWKH